MRIASRAKFHFHTIRRLVLACLFGMGVLMTNDLNAQTLQALADRAAIAEQVARYSYTADGKDLEGFVALFTEDAVWMSVPPGATEPNLRLDSRQAIKDFSADLHKRNAEIRTGHHQSGLIFLELTATTARTRNMILVTHQGPEDASPRVNASGVYHDTWQKTPAGWLIRTRTLHMETLPLGQAEAVGP